ncbi:pseudouridine synthase [Mangrovicoccus sp. HB161399]|uniref:pseudouridine synthase n=1 Tax=Mangrovicoccus sp. HB161399 TaxID=2720392 RepID=UPI0015579680|nr:pseudouridine synthase [Mangrovicoccus sp. HB161399]
MTETPSSPAGERIAKVLARAGVASRREAETIIAEGRVRVNGKIINSPALNVTDSDRILVDGAPLAEAEPPRLWLYHKPAGLVTTAKDEKGRETIFDKLPEDMPRVMSVGRLDLNSEGLLLLTNDGAIKRKLELPATGWLRKYRVRVKGTPEDKTLEPLRKGVTVEGERFQPMEISLDRQQGANAWLTVGLREGKNREIRRAMESVGLVVNRLIRVSYGPFRLNELAPGAVEEVKARVLKDQLGLGEHEDKPRLKPQRTRRTGPKPGGRPREDDFGDLDSRRPAKPAAARSERPARSSGGKADFAKGPRSGGKPGAPRAERSGGFADAARGDRPARGAGGKPDFANAPRSGGKPGAPCAERSGGFADAARGDRPARGAGGKPDFSKGPRSGGKPGAPRAERSGGFADAARSDRPARGAGGKPDFAKAPRSGGKPGGRPGPGGPRRTDGPKPGPRRK